MAVTRKLRKFTGSAREYDTPGVVTKNMNEVMAPSERVVAMQYVDGAWYVLTEELIMGPSSGPQAK